MEEGTCDTDSDTTTVRDFACDTDSDITVRNFVHPARPRFIYSLTVPRPVSEVLELEFAVAKQWDIVRALSTEEGPLPANVPLPPSPPPEDEVLPAQGSLEIDIYRSSPVLLSPPPTPTEDVSNVVRRIPKPDLPIRIHEGGPFILSREAQDRIMKWVYGYPWENPTIEWMIEPDHERIRETVRPYLQQLGHRCDDIEVEYLTEGAFNKIFVLTITNHESTDKKQYVFRISPPMDPFYKTESDVATTEIVRHFTDVPVPIIYAFDSSMNNVLGLEWVLMEKIVGKPLFDTWNLLEDDQQMQIVKTVAAWTKQLTAIQSDKIGSLYMKSIGSDLTFYVGHSVNFYLFMDTRLYHDINRGPYSSMQDFYAAVLNASDQDIDMNIAGLPDETEDKSGESPSAATNDAESDSDSKDGICERAKEIDKENAERRCFNYRHLKQSQDACVILQYALPLLCDRLPEASHHLRTYLMHTDLSLSNIMVNDAGIPVAVLDWEFTDLEPLSICQAWPVFLESEQRSQYPKPFTPITHPKYAHYSAKELKDTEDLDARQFQQRIKDYKMTKLRVEWAKELERIGSPLAAGTSEEGFEYARDLQQRILNMDFDAWQHPQWVKDLTGCYLSYSDDEEEDQEEEGATVEDCKTMTEIASVKEAESSALHNKVRE